MENDNYDIVIIGGAVIGSSIAYWLSCDPATKGRVLVVERDSSYVTSSTALSAASIRMQFSNPINVAISKFGIDFIRGFTDLFSESCNQYDLALKENGYLFMAGTLEQCETLRENVDVQRAGGANTSLLSPDELKAKYPFFNCDDIMLAALGTEGEGWFDNMGLLNGFRTLAKQQGVTYIKDEVTGFQKSLNRITGVELKSGRVISADEVVNAAGPRAAMISKYAGIDLPVEARKRTTFVFQAPEPPPANAPLFVDFNGLYVRPEGEFWMGATQPIEDLEVDFDDFEPRHAEFENIIWPLLYNRSKKFKAIKLRRMWAGHYAYNTLDQNAIVGRHPDIVNMVFANGFSGHGLQQAPAVGRAVAELILCGLFQTLDLSALGLERIIRGEPFFERNVV